MIHVLLTVLKILGILLAAVIGLLLFLLLIVLMVPVRYRGRAEKRENISAKGVVSWLLHIVHCSAEYEGNGVTAVVRIFGIRVYPKREGKAPKEKKTKGAAKTGGREKPVNDIKEVAKVEENDSAATSAAPDISKKSEVNTQGLQEPDKLSGEVTNTQGLQEPDKLSGEAEPENSSQTLKNEQSDTTFEEKIEKIEEKIDELLDAADEKTQAVYDKIKKKRSDIAEKLTNIYNKAELVLQVTGDERVRSAIVFVKKQAGMLLKAVLPRRMSGEAQYGFADPSTTGYVTTALAVIYCRTGKSFLAEPDFENEVLEGNVSFKGYIRLGRIVFIALRVVLNRDCRYSYKLIKKD